MKIFYQFSLLVALLHVLSVWGSTMVEGELASGEDDLIDVIISNPTSGEGNKEGLGETTYLFVE
jgi:hypothetical protein